MRQKKNRWQILSVALAVFLAMSLLTGCKKQTRETKEIQTTVFGIDVARYQGTIDWQAVSQADIDFAMVRVGYRGITNGELTEDSNGRYNLQEATKAGIPVGVYFFSTAVTEEEAEEEAAWVAEIIKCYPITYPVAYDCENFTDPDSRQYHMSEKERTNVALAFLKTIERLGYEGMFYASKGDMETYHRWEMDRIEDKYKVWVAQYPAEPYPVTPQTSYSGVHHMWQYSMEGEVAGIKAPVDLNIAYFAYDGIESAKSKDAPKEVEPDVEAMMDFDTVNEQVTAKEETNLRDIPSQDIDATVLVTLKNGQIAQRIAVSPSGWSKLIYEGQVYYAVSNYLTTDLKYGYDTDIQIAAEANEDDIQTKFHKTNQNVTAKDVVNLRNLPSVEHAEVDVITQLKNGDVATCIGTSDNGWSKLIYRGTTCYAISSYLIPVEDMAEEAAAEDSDIDLDFAERNETVTAKDKVNLRDHPNTDDRLSNVITQLQNGDMAIRVGISSNGWSKLVYNGRTCYAVSRYLEVTNALSEITEVKTKFLDVEDRVTAKDEVNLRSLPSVEDPNCVVVATLKNGEYVTRTGINGELGWSRVEYNGQTLYCVTRYLKPQE